MATSGLSLSRTGQVPPGGAPVSPLPHDRVDRPLAALAEDYSGGHDTGWHSHERAQLLYATRGVMRVATRAAAFVVPPGRALWVPAGLPHRVSMQDGVAMRALFLRRDAAEASVGPAETAVVAVTPLLRELILAACSEPLEWNPAGRGGRVAALILDEIARARPLPLGVPSPRDPRLLRLAEILGSDPARPATLESWAAECGASPRTLTRLFRRETGMSFGRWRQQMRLAEAAALLAQGVPAARAAAAVGYSSVPAFGSAFRAAFGQTPGDASARLSPRDGGAGEARTVCPSRKTPREAARDV